MSATTPKSTTTYENIEIQYFSGDKQGKGRRYEVRRALPSAPEGGEAVEAWVEVPSVTTVLKCLDKPALPWWGMTVGVNGITELVEKGMIRPTNDGKLAYLDPADLKWCYLDAGVKAQSDLVSMLTKQKLTVNHTLDKASARGQGVHDALEAWAHFGLRPDPDKVNFDTQLPVYTDEERQYVRSLQRFCDDMGDAWETEASEVAVASYENRFAGRYDLRGRVTKDVTLTTQALTKDGKGALKKGVKTTTVPAGTSLLVDLKTSKRIYSSHLLQLEAYEGAGVECGLPATDARAVLHVSVHGYYQFKRATATYAEFLSVLTTYNALSRIEKEAL